MDSTEFGEKWPRKYERIAALETPYILFDADSGLLLLEGKSLPENPITVYGPVLDWLRSYIEQPAENTVFSVSLFYYNTSTSKILLNIIELLEVLHRKGHSVYVRWGYMPDDDDMEEAGHDFDAITAVPFIFIPLQDN